MFPNYADSSFDYFDPMVDDADTLELTSAKYVCGINILFASGVSCSLFETRNIATSQS